MKHADHDPQAGSAVARQILDRANSDLAFVPRLMGESLHLLNSHFVKLIENALSDAGVSYGDHPLLRPFIEMHSRELTDYVLNGVALRHQFGVEAIESLNGDPFRLLRVDLWDSLNTFIDDAERNFLHEPEGLKAILLKIGIEGHADPFLLSSKTARHDH